MIKKLIRCAQCNEVILHPEGLTDEGDLGLPGVEWSQEDLIRRKRFFESHKEHKVEELRVDPRSWVSESLNPGGRKISYFQTCNGRRKLLVRRTKPGLDQGAIYEIIPGKMRILNHSLTIQEEDLRKQISCSNGHTPLAKDKIEAFIKAFKEEVRSIPLEKVMKEMGMTQEGETSLSAYGSLKRDRWAKILKRCQKDFQQSEMGRIKEFIRKNNQPNDVLALCIDRRISILPSSKGRSA